MQRKHPNIRHVPGIRLHPSETMLLRAAFPAIDTLFIEREFRSGYSGALVLLVSLEAGKAPVVVKIAHPYDLQSEYDAYHQHVEKSAPQNTARLYGPPILAADGQLGALLYTFAGGDSHLPTSNLQEFFEAQGAKATVGMLNRLFRVYGRHWWVINRAEKFVLGEYYDHLLPVHLEMTVLEATDEAGVEALLLAGEVRVADIRMFQIGEQLCLQDFVVAKTNCAKGTITLQADPPAGEAAPPLRIRLLWNGEIPVEPGDRMAQVCGTLSATRFTLLNDVASGILSPYVSEQRQISLIRSVVDPTLADRLEKLRLRNPLHYLDTLLVNVVQMRVSVVHGDLNLNNMLIDGQTGFAWLIDFADTTIGPTLFDLQRLEVQIFTKLLPPQLIASFPQEFSEELSQNVSVEQYAATVTAALLMALHADPPALNAPIPAYQELYSLLAGIRRLVRHYLMDDLNWDEYYQGLMVALIGALKYDELDDLSRTVSLIAAASIKELLGVVLFPASDIASSMVAGVGPPPTATDLSSSKPQPNKPPAIPSASSLQPHDASHEDGAAEPTPTPMAMPKEPVILATKLYRPRLRSTNVVRPRLWKMLERGAHGGWILLVAAAGMGKTTLISEWTESHVERTCWLSLDRADDEPGRFFLYLTAAIKTCEPELTEGLFELLQTARTGTVDTVVDTLLNQLALLQERLIIVLDDYHHINEDEIHNAMARLLTHSPPQVTFILMTRVEPSLPLAKMRVTGELIEIRAEALAFTIEEATHFFNESFDLNLTSEQVDALTARTEGWSAGLQMAALALQTHVSDRGSFIQNFTGSHRHVLDYLMEEVMRVQPKSVRDFMMRISPLHQFNSALCQAVREESTVENSEMMLHYLETHNLFLTPLDDMRQWYRYHHLFADLLRQQLDASQPNVARQIQKRAATWYEAQGDIEQAVEYALMSKSHDVALNLIQVHMIASFWQTRLQTWVRWYRALPIDFLLDHPIPAAIIGHVMILHGIVKEVTPMLSQIGTDELDPTNRLISDYFNIDQRHDAESFKAIVEATPIDSLTPFDLTTFAEVVRASGDSQHACRVIEHAHYQMSQHENRYGTVVAAVHRCRHMALAGRLREAIDFGTELLDEYGEFMHEEVDNIGPLYFGIARALIAQNRLDEAEQCLHKVHKHNEATGYILAIPPAIAMLLAETYQAQGRLEQALAAAEESLDYFHAYDFPADRDWMAAYQAQIQLQQGDLTTAIDWLNGLRKLPPAHFCPRSICLLVEAQIRLAQDRSSCAIQILNDLTSRLPEFHTADAWVLLALAHDIDGHRERALSALTSGISIAEPENNLRAFLNQSSRYGPCLVRLLTHFSRKQPENAFVYELIAMLPTGDEAAG
ncbi:MAG: phosphotransferase [Chloroflexota bacterium]